MPLALLSTPRQFGHERAIRFSGQSLLTQDREAIVKGQFQMFQSSSWRSLQTTQTRICSSFLKTPRSSKLRISTIVSSISREAHSNRNCLNLSWESVGDGFVHPNVLVKQFPTQSTALQAQCHLREFLFSSVGQQRKFGGRKTHHTLIGQLQPNAMPLDPAPHGGCRRWRLTFHGSEGKRRGAFGNVPLRGVGVVTALAATVGRCSSSLASLSFAFASITP